MEYAEVVNEEIAEFLIKQGEDNVHYEKSENPEPKSAEEMGAGF